MKNFLTLIFFFSLCYADAQVGIGTTSPHSTLDVRGSLSVSYRSFTSATSASATDHTLVFTGASAVTLTLPDATACAGRIYSIKNMSASSPAAILTIATTSSQTIDAVASWQLDESKEAITVVSDGTNWKVSGGTPSKARDNYVIVKSAADFPAPVAGVITLNAGTLYEVNGTIVLADKIDLNGCYLVGRDVNNDKLIYTPGSGELFTGTKGGTLKVLTLAATTAGAKLFNLDMDGTEFLLVRDVIIANCNDVGLVKGGNIVFFSVVNYSGNLNGITYEDNIHLLLDNTAWLSNNSNTFEKMVGDFDIIDKLGGFSIPMSASSGVALDVTGITSIADAGNLKTTSFSGTGTFVSGTFSSDWEVEAGGLNTEKDDVASGNLYMINEETTTFSSSNTPVKIEGTTTEASLFRVTSPMDNRLTYAGEKTRRFQVLCSLTSSDNSWSNREYSFYIYKNGVQLPESKQKIKLQDSNDQVSTTLSCTVLLAKNDYVEVWAECNSGTRPLNVETFNFSIR